MSKIACFGGSFNPPHLGHLKIALTLLRQERFDEVWFIPSVSTPLKDEPLVAFDHRVRMVEALIAPYRKLKICCIEATLPQPSYTINTVKALQAKYPSHQFSWIIGSDQSDQFTQWKDADELLRRISFLVVIRDRSDTIVPTMKTVRVEGIDHISSTLVRQGKLNYTVPKVIAYIMAHELYLESIARSMVSERRWIHVVQVEKLAQELGAYHHMDPHQIALAALFHDCTKMWHKDTQEKWLSFTHPEYLRQPMPIWHQKTGAAYVGRFLQIKDKAVIGAIANHVTGQSGHPLTQLIYIADKCEPSRNYDVARELAAARTDLDKAADLVRKNQEDYLKKEKNASEPPAHR